MIKVFSIALGGALGAVLRYAVSVFALRVLGPDFPWGTLLANLLGCFFIGLCWALANRIPFPPRLVPFLFTGVLGAFTTFSTYGLESILLLREGAMWRGLANIAASNGLGLLAVVLGFGCAYLLTEGFQ